MVMKWNFRTLVGKTVKSEVKTALSKFTQLENSNNWNTGIY